MITNVSWQQRIGGFMKVTVIWQRPTRWWMWLLLPPYFSLWLALTPLFLPGFLALALAFPYRWLHGNYSKTRQQYPIDGLKRLAWELPTMMLYLLLTPLVWYSNRLSWAVSKLPFQRQPDPI